MFLYFRPDGEPFWPCVAFSGEGKAIPSWVLKSKAAAPRLLFSISVPVPMACPADSSRQCFIRGWSSPPRSHVNSLRFNMLPLTFPSLWSCVTTGSRNHSCLSLDSQGSVSPALCPLGQSRESKWMEREVVPWMSSCLEEVWKVVLGKRSRGQVEVLLLSANRPGLGCRGGTLGPEEDKGTGPQRRVCRRGI